MRRCAMPSYVGSPAPHRLIERHKAARMRDAVHQDAAATAPPATAASATWKAGGDAWAWAASMRGRAACTGYRKACEANGEADDALGMVAAAGASSERTERSTLPPCRGRPRR